MTKTTKRSDIHRPGAIIPADYSCWGFFDFGGANEPPWGTEILSSPAVHAAGYARSGDDIKGNCHVCGARFRFGALFQHTPTGKFIIFGHDCASKYEMLADFAAAEETREMHRRANAPAIQAAKRARDYERYLDRNPGLREALACGHRITNDLAEKLRQYRSLSPAQIALAHKLHSELFCPARPTEANVPAPVGRQTVRGIVVSCKTYDSDFGVTLKMTVKVTTAAGTWLCWGTVPESLRDACHAAAHGPGHIKGAEVEFTATLKKGREAHFAIFSRPTNGSLITPSPAAEESARLSVRPGLAVTLCEKMNAEMAS
jgi:hypothetical protein